MTELQTNDLLIADFGQLYNQPRSKDEATLKRVSNFVTNNRIRVEAHTALTPMRGGLYQQRRPDFILRDDLENAITADSPAITEKIIRLLDEAKGGIAGQGASLTLGNLIIENGVMGYVRKPMDGASGRVRFIPIVTRQGTLSWPDKYVKTDAEALLANQNVVDPSKRKISLESKRRELNGGGRRVYEVEMLLDPVAAGSPFFDRPTIERPVSACVERREERAGLALWAEYNPAHRYALGADTGKGNGNDHSTSVLIDFSTIAARQVGSYANNLIPADQFAYELKRQADLFGSCLIAPEKNSLLRRRHLRQVPLDRISDEPLGSGEVGCWPKTPPPARAPRE